MWSETETVVALPKIGGEQRTETSRDGTSVKVKYEALDGADAVMTVEVRYAHGRVVPESASKALTLCDPDGEPLKFPPQRVKNQIETLSYDNQSGSYHQIDLLTVQYKLRPGDSAKPAKLTFSASSLHLVEIPFHFKDVPVQLGGGVVAPSREHLKEYERSK
jgi:hypothetical protein